MGTVNPRPSQRRPAPWRPHFGSSSPVSVAASVRGQTSARRSWPRVEMRQELPVSIPSRFLAVRKLTSASGFPRLKSSPVDGGTTVGRLASVPIAVACSFPPRATLPSLEIRFSLLGSRPHLTVLIHLQLRLPQFCSKARETPK